MKRCGWGGERHEEAERSKWVQDIWGVGGCVCVCGIGWEGKKVKGWEGLGRSVRTRGFVKDWEWERMRVWGVRRSGRQGVRRMELTTGVSLKGCYRRRGPANKQGSKKPEELRRKPGKLHSRPLTPPPAGSDKSENKPPPLRTHFRGTRLALLSVEICFWE